MIRWWCLQRDAGKRPTVAQILQHRLLCPEAAAVPAPQWMQFFWFLSHAQADAAGTVADLYHAFRRLGLHSWIDMRQEKLTLEGMQQVNNADRIMLRIFFLCQNVSVL